MLKANSDMNNFEKLEHKKEKEIAEFEDLCGLDLSDIDMRLSSVENLATVDFDTETKWPASDNLPVGFDPKKILEDSKNPGLGLKRLHTRKIDGQGITVAIIDQKLDTNHPEYSKAIKSYEEYDGADEETISMHGPAVASLLVGKDCGVAPGAKLVYKAVPSGRSFLSEAQALDDIIRDNENVPQNEKVRVVSCSIGYMTEKPELGLNEWIVALKKAKEHGVFVVDVGGNQIGVPFSGGGSQENKDDFEGYLSWLRQDEGDKELNKVISEGDVNRILKRLREIKKDDLVNISDLGLRKKIEEHLDKRKKEIVVPSDYRTMASSWNKEGQYMYNGRGGISWSVPYLAGLLALALQVNPNIKQKEIAEIINESAIINKNGLKVINPEGIIELVKKVILN